MKKQIATTVMIMSLALVVVGCSCNSSNKNKLEEDTTIKQEKSLEETTTLKEEQETSEVPEETTTVAEETTTEAPTVPLTIAEANGITPIDTTKYTKSSLNVRGDASVGAELLGKLEMNTKVHVTGDVANGWKRIEFNGSVGYVSGDYLSDTITVIEDVPVATERPTQQVVQQEPPTKAPSQSGSSFSGEIGTMSSEERETWWSKIEQELKDGGMMDENGNWIEQKYNISSGNSSGSSNQSETNKTIPDFPGTE